MSEETSEAKLTWYGWLGVAMVFIGIAAAWQLKSMPNAVWVTRTGASAFPNLITGGYWVGFDTPFKEVAQSQALLAGWSTAVVPAMDLGLWGLYVIAPALIGVVLAVIGGKRASR